MSSNYAPKMSGEASDSATPAAVTIKIRLRAGVDAEFSSWHAKMSTAAAGLPGFISAEVNAPTLGGDPEWRIVQHFRSADQLHAWRNSEQHRRLLLEGDSLADGGASPALSEEEAAEDHSDGIVTEVVTTFVKPGKDQEYREWAERIHRVEAQFPGYCGGFLQPPASERQHYWTTLVRFATPEQLDTWLSSSARRDLLREHEALVESWEHHRLPTSFAGWFPIDPASGRSPSTWKQSMLVVLTLFPIVMFEVRFLSPLLSGLNSAVATFIGNVISVALLAWPFMPLAIGATNWWLLSPKDGAKWINPAGIALISALYAAEIAALWRLI